MHRLDRTSTEISTAQPPVQDATGSSLIDKNDHQSKIPITILYGSNSGTCESMAQRLASDAATHGYHVAMLCPLDAATGSLPLHDPRHPVIIVTASYEGQPPDNATDFVKWIEGLGKDESAFQDMKYAVFGCGHHDWSQTFHRIPRLVDRKLAELGGKRLTELGLVNVAEEDPLSVFEDWADEVYIVQPPIHAITLTQCLNRCSGRPWTLFAGARGGLHRTFKIAVSQ